MANIQDGSATFHVVDSRTEQKRKEMVDLVYPVGIVVAIANDNKPDFMNYGKWEKVAPGRTLWGADSSHTAGSTIEAGLPNITGEASNSRDIGLISNEGNGKTSGAFSKGAKYENDLQTAGGHQTSGLKFDASKSNSIYGNSTTVQPDAYVVNFWKRVE